MAIPIRSLIHPPRGSSASANSTAGCVIPHEPVVNVAPSSKARTPMSVPGATGRVLRVDEDGRPHLDLRAERALDRLLDVEAIQPLAARDGSRRDEAPYEHGVRLVDSLAHRGLRARERRRLTGQRE